MALKDLVADRSKITEEMIENIISAYVRYDSNKLEIVLTPDGVALGNDAKVLVVLVAHLGWEFVVDEVPIVDTKPAALEALTGIHGGTLRPVLKKLKDAHLLAVNNGSYSVRVANLDAIGHAVSGEKAIAPPKQVYRKWKLATEQTTRKSSKVKADAQGEVVSSNKGKRKIGTPGRSSLEDLLRSGFFSEARTLRQVVARLHEKAIIAKSTSLSGPIAEFVREEKLERMKIMEGAREIWCYKAV